MSQRALGEIVRPRLQSGACARPLNFTVRRMADVDLSARPLRVFEALFGLVAALLGAALLVFAALGASRALGGQVQTSVLVMCAIALGLGVLLLVAGLRLLTGKRRRDGGLLSPWTLRFGGLIFFVGPIVMLFAKPSLLIIVKAAASFGIGVACFALANRREQHTLRGDSDAPNNRWRGP